MPEWFRRFGEIPGVSYTPPGQIDRLSLAGRDDVPEVHSFRFDGKLEETLSWPTGYGSRGGSASPTHYRAFSAFPDPRNVPALAQAEEEEESSWPGDAHPTAFLQHTNKLTAGSQRKTLSWSF